MIKVVGVTGFMGSGKSHVSNIFNTYGAYLFNTDIIANKVQISNQELKRILIDKFGEEYYVDGQINKIYVRNLLFDETDESKENLKWVTEVVGKYVIEYFEKYKQSLIDKGIDGYILIESAILFETGLNKLCDYTICVKSQSPLMAAIKRDNISKEEWQYRMSTQLPDEQKCYDYIINNDYSINVNEQIKIIHEKINEIK